LLNDTQLIEAARFIGARMLEAGETTAEQARFGFRLVTGRLPGDKEMTSLEQALADAEKLFTNDTEAATKLLTVGEAKLETELPVARLAAATMVASMLLNHDEAVMRR
jgi:hypothetical protein